MAGNKPNSNQDLASYWRLLLPNFFIIGANKAGTTSLHYYCSQHPDIFMSAAKEPMFFTSKKPSHNQTAIASDQKIINRSDASISYHGFFSLQDYLELFKSATEPLRGESSTNYLFYPDTAMWIRKINPDSKIIAILRDPIDRAVSDFEFQTRVNKSEKRTFSQAINDDLNGRIDPNHKELVLGNLSTPPGRYLYLGLYGSQISRYKEYFPDNQLFIADYEEYDKDTHKFMKKIYSFLGVDDFKPDTSRFNVSSPKKAKPPLDSDLKSKVREFFEDDIARLQGLVNFDVTKWLDRLS